MIYRSRVAIVIIISLFLLASCKKTVEPIQQNIAEQYFEQNILNRDFVVHYAVDNGTNLTSEYSGYKFRLLKTTLYNGPMTAIKNGVTYNGDWSSSSDFGKLDINLINSSSPLEFTFLSRSWRFTKKAIPVMELAPWGTTDAKILHMERQ